MRVGAREAGALNENCMFIGCDAMRALLALSLLITLSASASAAAMYHSRHVIVRPSKGYVLPGWAYSAPPPPTHYDDTPSYDDPSKFGGDTALPVTH